MGLDPSTLDPSRSVEERVLGMLPYLKRMRNTAMSWSLRRILGDLFDVQVRDLDEATALELIGRVDATGRDPDWPNRVLRDRAGIVHHVTSLGNASEVGRERPDHVEFMLDLHYLFCPGVATDLTPFFQGRTTRAAYLDALETVFATELGSSQQLTTAVADWLDQTVQGPVRFSNTFLPIEQRFAAPDSGRVDAILSRGGPRDGLTDEEIDELVAAVTWAILGWHHEHRKALQIAVGAEYFICDGKSIVRAQESWFTQMCRVFHTFGGARFDIMLATESMAQELAVVCRQFPNVYASGYWWHAFVPEIIRRTVALRTQIAPMTKWSGFLSDAYTVEWTYGKLQVVHGAMSDALAGQIEAGALDEDDLPELLHQILHESPKALYELNPQVGSGGDRT